MVIDFLFFISINFLSGSTLRSKGLNRIGNLLVPNDNYIKFEEWINPILTKMIEEQETEKIKWTPSKCNSLII